MRSLRLLIEILKLFAENSKVQINKMFLVSKEYFRLFTVLVSFLMNDASFIVEPCLLKILQ